MQTTTPLLYGQYYHIYNCGINGENLFREHTNYEYFLHLYEKYIGPIAETYAWCLMGNHFHLLVRIKEMDEMEVNIENQTPDRVLNPVRGNKINNVKPPHLYFSHLFNAYSQAFNKMYERHGSLFERSFKRKHIDNEVYLKKVVLYIHNNPVHHGFCNNPVEYAWSSFLVDTTDITAVTNREEVIDWFGGKTEFELAHNHNKTLDDIKKYLDD
jgi:putative transposase